MTTAVKCTAAVVFLLFVASPAFGGPCTQSIATVQRDVDSAIERSAGAGGWKTEGLGATRGHQPTPRSLAAAEGSNDADFIAALDSLERARAADNAGDAVACNLQLANARAALR